MAHALYGQSVQSRTICGVKYIKYILDLYIFVEGKMIV